MPAMGASTTGESTVRDPRVSSVGSGMRSLSRPDAGLPKPRPLWFGDGMARTRIASFNVENMFDRPRVMNAEDWAEGAPVLAAYARFNELAQLSVYDTGTRDELLHLLEVMGCCARTRAGSPCSARSAASC